MCYPLEGSPMLLYEAIADIGHVDPRQPGLRPSGRHAKKNQTIILRREVEDVFVSLVSPPVPPLWHFPEDLSCYLHEVPVIL